MMLASPSVALRKQISQKPALKALMEPRKDFWAIPCQQRGKFLKASFIGINGATEKLLSNSLPAALKKQISQKPAL